MVPIKSLINKMYKNILITTPSNVLYLTSFNGTFGEVILTNKKTYLLTDSRYIEYAKTACHPRESGDPVVKAFEVIDIATLGYFKTLEKLIKKHKIETLYFEANNLTVARLNNIKKNLKPKAPLLKGVGGIDSIENLRFTKSNEEIKLIKKSQQLNDEVLDAAKKSLKSGQSEKEIAWKIREIAFHAGCDDISFETIVAINENSAIPHHSPTDKKLKKGDLILIDMGVKYKNYCSDMTRMIFTKTPTTIEQNIYSIVLDAQLNAIKNTKVGMKCSEVDAFARNFIKEKEYGDKFGHSLGHGIGLDVHEAPSVSSKSNEILKTNSVITFEPGIYLPGKFGVRIEDMGIIKEKNVEIITSSPKEINECIIKIS